MGATASKLAQLEGFLQEAEHPVDNETISALHEAGRRTAREQLQALFDENSFVEVDALAKHRVTQYGMDRQKPATDGVVTGYGTVDGRKLCAYAQDSTIFDGQLGEVYGEKITKIYDLALKSGVPLVAFLDGTGARLKEGIVALSSYAKIYALMSQASGVIPQIAVVSGQVSGPNALLPTLADIAIFVSGSTLFTTDPSVISQVSGSPATAESVGSATVHATSSGIAALTAPSDADAVVTVKDVLAYLPSNNRADAPRDESAEMSGAILGSVSDRDELLDHIIPDSDREAYDVHGVLEVLTDEGSVLEVYPEYAPHIVTAFARIEGRPVGIVANQPSVLAGCLTPSAATKAASFVRLCDAFTIPVLTVVDAPGFVPDAEAEQAGLARAAGGLAAAYAEATVGMLTVITRAATSTVYSILGAKDLGADLVFAWPTAHITVSDPTSNIENIYDYDLDNAKRKGKDVEALRSELTAAYRDYTVNPYRAAELGMVDTVIIPSETRAHLIEGLRLVERKAVAQPLRKHSSFAQLSGFSR